jgi:hypothetical protein
VTDISVSQGETAVPPNRPIAIGFSDRPAWETVSAQTITLESGTWLAPVDYALDLVACRVTLWPREPLKEGLIGRLRIERSLESVSGVPLDAPVDVTFTTGDSTETYAPSEPVASARVQTEVFDPHCGCCHDPDGGDYRHVLRLQAATVSELSSGQQPDRRLVVFGSHGSSYLLHKVLGLESITGQPMPPPGASCAALWPSDRLCASTDGELQLLGRWIAAGPLF